MRQCIIIFFACVFSIYRGYAGGYQLNTQGIRQMAMGGSGTALTWNSDIIFYNPAGMADLTIWELSVSGAGILSNTNYSNLAYGASSQQTLQTPVNLYIGGPIAKTRDRVAFGLGIYTPFGNYIKWADQWQGSLTVQETRLQTLAAQPTVSYKITNKLSIGAGYAVAVGEEMSRKALPVIGSNTLYGSSQYSARYFGTGFNAGLRYKVAKRIQVGLSYRSEIKLYTDQGKATFDVAQYLADSFPATKFMTEIPFPQVATFGIGYRPSYKLTLQADVSYNGWKNYKRGYNFAQNTTVLQDIDIPYSYQYSLAYRLGANYAFSEKFAAMLGGAWEESPISPGTVNHELPDADKVIATGGIYYRPFNKLIITLAVQYDIAREDIGIIATGLAQNYRQKAIRGGFGVAVDF